MRPRAAASVARASAPRTGRSRPSSPSSPDRSRPCEALGRELPVRCDQAERDRQVEVAALLAQVGGGEMNDDGAMVELDSRVADGAAHALLALAHRGVAEADQVGLRHAEAHVDLDRDQLGVDAPGGGAEDGGQHGEEGRRGYASPCTRRFD